MFAFRFFVVVFLSIVGILATPSNNRDDLQDKELAEIKEMVKLQSELIQSQAEMLNKYDQRIGEKQSRTRRVADMDNNTAVGFYSRLVSPHPLQLGQHQAIEFDQIITNVGNGYDSRRGHFTAPVAGLYSFTSTVLLASSNNHNMHISIVKNGVIVGLMFSVTEYDKGTRTVVLSLAVGDMVWVRNNGNELPNIHGVGYSTFSGFLITPYSQ
ncbi:complement C1q-like protein 4 [Pecten maximus]|uniref:complement C1q-like protein 4 n=1 Tax=Pecten maximus TaxID=6579 RepID=UPI0014589EB1|nr:complement C1q-like protein 4 [Pecten maximus]